jgi:cell wall-associated NlpC family hydrolase
MLARRPRRPRNRLNAGYLTGVLVALVLLGITLGGVGVERPVADAAPREAPAHKIAHLRAKAARVQAAIDRMRARVERLVEDYNEVREALARTRVEQARTRRQVLEARRRPRAARRLLGRRLWTIYTGGAPSTLGQLLGADSVHQALVTTKYQEQVVGRTGPPWTRSSGCAARWRRSPPSGPPGQEAPPDRAPPGRPAPLPPPLDQAGQAGGGPGAAPPGDPAPPRPAAPPGPARARSWPGWAGGGAGAPSGAAARAVAFARGQLGKPYVWGAAGPSSYDWDRQNRSRSRSSHPGPSCLTTTPPWPKSWPPAPYPTSRGRLVALTGPDFHQAVDQLNRDTCMHGGCRLARCWKVASLNPAAPWKVASLNKARPWKVTSLNKATPWKVAPTNWACMTDTCSKLKSTRVAPVRSRLMPGQKGCWGEELGILTRGVRRAAEVAGEEVLGGLGNLKLLLDRVASRRWMWESVSTIGGGRLLLLLHLLCVQLGLS